MVWNFTNQCNLACEHCYQNAHSALPDELTLHKKMGLIDEFVENDVSALALSGGEPLSHPDFWPAV
nr:radical SAM protein [Papillibacter cinnamivorans]